MLLSAESFSIIPLDASSERFQTQTRIRSVDLIFPFSRMNYLLAKLEFERIELQDVSHALEDCIFIIAYRLINNTYIFLS